MGRRMGTIVNFKENIEYQKKNLQEVYKSYFNIKNQNDLESDREQKEESAVTKDSVEIDDTIVILMDNFDDVLQKIFCFSDEMMKKEAEYESEDFSINDYIDDFNEIVIEKTYGEFQIQSDDSKIYIQTLFSYNIGNCKIVFLKNNTSRKTFRNAARIFSLRKLSIFERQSLKEKMNKFKQIDDLDELKEELIKIKLTYDESYYIDKLEKKYTMKEKINTDIFENQYRCSISFDIINSLKEQKLLKKDHRDICGFIYDELMKFYNNEVSNILKTYVTNDFIQNYRIVDFAIEARKGFYKEVLNIINSRIMGELQHIKELESEVESWNRLMNSSIIQFDRCIIKSIEELNKNINGIS